MTIENLKNKVTKQEIVTLVKMLNDHKTKKYPIIAGSKNFILGGKCLKTNDVSAYRELIDKLNGVPVPMAANFCKLMGTYLSNTKEDLTSGLLQGIK